LTTEFGPLVVGSEESSDPERKDDKENDEDEEEDEPAVEPREQTIKLT
jgi:hypothetical protein